MQDPIKTNTCQISDLNVDKESQLNCCYNIEVSYNRISNTGKIYPEHGKFFVEKKEYIWIGGKDKRKP